MLRGNLLARIDWRFVVAAALLGASPVATADAADPPAAMVKSPVAPEDSFEHFELDGRLRIELVACEPLVVDPVAVRFDEDGRMWVVEYRDYPNGPAPGEQPQSQIKILTDVDADGRYDQAAVFADHLMFVNGIQPWRGGAFVTRAGEIAYMKDTDGDGRADVDEVWFTGFSEQNPQLRVNHPTFSLDHRIYVCNGLRGGVAVNHRVKDQEPISVSGRDLSFDPFTGRAEAVSGNGQFGLTYDDFGNRFNCFNRSGMMHVVLPERYLARNKFLAVPAVFQDVMPAADASRIFSITTAWTTSVLHVGQFTATCGVEVFRGNAMPADFYGDGFVCEPTASVVHREIVTPLGATFAGKPAYEGREFLASRDSWFKPVNLETGPDGALYVVDMYRAVIEHPQFMPAELKNRPDLRYGDDRGRIYRVVAADAQLDHTRPAMSGLSSADLVALFERPTAWWRETAARVIFERQDQSAREPLERMVRNGRSPAARSQALWSLDGLDALSAETVEHALSDVHARVREQAVILAEPHLRDSSAIRGRVVELAGDEDPRLAFQVALSLGESLDPETVPALSKLAIRRAGDVWLRRAVLSSTGERTVELVMAIIDLASADASTFDADAAALALEAVQVVGARANQDDVRNVLGALDQLPQNAKGDLVRFQLAGGLARGLQSGGVSLRSLVEPSEGKNAALAKLGQRLFDRAANAVDASDEQLAAAACNVLGQASFDVARKALVEVIERPTSQSVRASALAALAAQPDPRVAEILIARLPLETPAGRVAVLDGLMSRSERVEALLNAVESGAIRATELDPLRAKRLTDHRDSKIRDRARRLLAAALPADRTKVLEEYRATLTMKTDPQRGREVFQKNCSTCHRIGELGVDVAPSIADSRNKTPDQLLVDILQPSIAIDNNYISYSASTVDGVSYTGIIASETASSVTMKLPEGKTVSLLRSEIDELRSNGISLMPDGLERNIPLQDMADLMSFVKNWRYLDTAIPVDTTTFGAMP